jgi:ABC-2 type transport system ATP-binding protein
VSDTAFQPAIDVRGMTRVYQDGDRAVRALDDVTLQIAAGECVALLGVNGAGKTTLAKVLSTLLLPTSGTARVAGFDVVREAREVRSRIAVVFGGERGLYSMLTGRENLEYFGMLAGVRRRVLRTRVPELLAQVGLADAQSRRVEGYSKGMKQRLHIAAGLIGDPEVLLLDEPTLGLDPNEAERLRGQIGQLAASGVTVLLTSHYLLDVERLAGRVVIIDRGRITNDLTLREFAAVCGYEAAVTVTTNGAVPRGVVRAAEGIAGVAVSQLEPPDADGAGHMTVLVDSWQPRLLEELGRAFEGASVVEMRVRAAGLEEAFARLTRGPEAQTGDRM